MKKYYYLFLSSYNINRILKYATKYNYYSKIDKLIKNNAIQDNYLIYNVVKIYKYII